MLYTIYKKGPRWNKDFDYKFDYILFDIEMLQLFLRLGTFQLSDLFYNTVGGALGGLMYYAGMKVRKHL